MEVEVNDEDRKAIVKVKILTLDDTTQEVVVDAVTNTVIPDTDRLLSQLKIPD